jgi:hypothetical protein
MVMVFKILQYSEMECNCVRKITEGWFWKYSTLWQHKGESQITVLRILYTLAGGPLNFETSSSNNALIDWRLTPTLAIFQLYCGILTLENSDVTQYVNYNVFTWSATKYKCTSSKWYLFLLPIPLSISISFKLRIKSLLAFSVVKICVESLLCWQCIDIYRTCRSEDQTVNTIWNL